MTADLDRASRHVEPPPAAVRRITRMTTTPWIKINRATVIDADLIAGAEKRRNPFGRGYSVFLLLAGGGSAMVQNGPTPQQVLSRVDAIRKEAISARSFRVWPLIVKKPNPGLDI